MSLLKRLLPRIVFLASFGAWAFILTLMLAIARFNVPSIVDDFCFGWVAKQYGIFAGAYYYYMGWSGRYFGNLLMHCTPLYFSSDFTYLQLNTYFLLGLGFVTSLFAIRRISSWEFSDQRLWTSVFLFQSAVLYSISGLYQWFYWFTGIYYYISIQLILLFLVVYFTMQSSRKRTIILSLLLLGLMGTSEVSMLMFSAVFWGYQVWLWRFKGPIQKELYLLFAIWLLGFLAVMLSPGNQVRAVSHVNLTEGLHILFSNLIDLAIQFATSPLCWAFCLWMWWIFPSESIKPVSRLNLGVISLLFFGAILMSFIPLSFALGEPHIPARILSLYVVFLLIYVAFTLVQLKHYLPNGRNAGIGVLILMLAGVWKSDNARMLTRELMSGQAAAYSAENHRRFEKIRLSTSDTVTVELLQTRSKIFFGEELSQDPKHLWCKCVANYYGKKAVHLKKD